MCVFSSRLSDPVYSTLGLRIFLLRFRARIFRSNISRSHYVAVVDAGALIFSLENRTMDLRGNDPRWISRPVAQLTRKYCKLVPSSFAVLSRAAIRSPRSPRFRPSVSCISRREGRTRDERATWGIFERPSLSR